MSPIMLAALLLVAIIVFVIAVYNKMIKMRNQADEAWSDIDVQLKRRYNLIPNLVETVKGYAAHEEGVFTKVTEARTSAINAGSMKEQAQAENMLSGALKSLFAVAENYPELKANENFMQLQNELVDTEDKIQAARRFYNGTVRDYNTKLQQFPNSIIAGMFKFEPKEFFEVEDEEQKKNVEVSFKKEDEKKEEVPAAAPAPTPTPEATPAEEPKMEEPAAEPAAPVEEEPKEEVKEEAPAEPAAPAEEPKTEEAPAPIEETPASETPAEPTPVEEPKVEEPVAEEPKPEGEEKPEEPKPAA